MTSCSSKLYVFEKPLLLLCEGESDRRFFNKLIEARDIPRNFNVRFPGRNEKDTGGRAKFGKWLDRARVGETFKILKGILIVSDNDEDAQASFQEVQSEISKVEGCPVPIAEQNIVQAETFPTVSVLMIPTGQLGNLETLCLPAAAHRWNLTDALNTFVAASPAAAWGLGKQSKARLQATLAMTCKSNPSTTFSYHWDEHDEEDDYCIPLNNPCFDSVADFLRLFENSVLET